MANISNAEREKRAVEKALAEKEKETQALLDQQKEFFQKQMEEMMKSFEEKLKSQASVAKTSTDNTREGKPKVKIPLDTIIPVKAGVQSGLVYISPKTGARYVWDKALGATEYLELSELVTMKNTHRTFFEKNWIYIGDADEYTSEEILNYLQVARYYVNSLTEDEIAGLFDKSIADIIGIVKKAPSGVKDTIASMATKRLDEIPRGKIKALEEALGVYLDPDDRD